MKYSNEVKVGLSLVLAALVFYFGIRYMQNIPLFQGSYVLETSFADASGLGTGNPVRVNGVNVGTVESVTLDPQARRARVRFRVDKSVQIPEGSTASISGVSALGGVRLSISLGAPDNAPIPPGGFVPSPPEEDILAQLSDQAPVLAARTDSLLRSANQTLEDAQTLFKSPDSGVQTTLSSIRGSADALSTLLREDLEQLNEVVANTELLTEELGALVRDNRDSLNATVDNVNRVLSQTERNLVVLERTSTNLDRIIQKIDEGEGTIGRLVNDPSLYVRLDSAATRLNTILDDFQQQPGRYLKDMTLVRVF
ncbi:MAG: MCE family protein [Bacteroidetes bacterium]|nr:MCE family protein [Bacteroidota bacterium]